jgi:phage shock protein C
MQTKRLYRSRDQKMFAGICGGIGRYYDIDPTFIRLVLCLSIFVGLITFFALFSIYSLAWMIIPLEPKALNIPTNNNQFHE